jgi:dienelactone hydrolase
MKTILVFLTLLWTTTVFGQSAEVIKFEGTWKDKPILLKAELQMPKTNKPVPLLIVQHSSGPDTRLSSFSGYTDSIGYAVGNAALQNGYAVVYTDVFTPRNISKDSSGDIGIGTKVALKDIKQLLRTLLRDPRFNKEQVYLFGHSYGGGVALRASYDKSWNNTNPFKAIVTSGPGCQVNEESRITTPTKMFVGEKDDWTSPTLCATLVNKQRAKESKIELELVKGANHSYSYNGTWMWNRQSRSGCNASVVEKSNGKLLIDGNLITTEEFKNRCLKQGATSGGSGEQVGYLVNQTIQFFKSIH